MTATHDQASTMHPYVSCGCSHVMLLRLVLAAKLFLGMLFVTSAAKKVKKGKHPVSVAYACRSHILMVVPYQHGYALQTCRC